MPILAAYKIVYTINKNVPPPPRGVARGRELEQTCRRRGSTGVYHHIHSGEKRAKSHVITV